MRVRITFYGMFLIELDEKEDVARVLAISATHSATHMNRPYHHPILCSNKDTVVMEPDWPAIPSLKGLLDRASGALKKNAIGWHLSGTTMAVGGGRLPEHHRGFDPDEPRYPSSTKGAWDSLKWIPDLKAIQPGARLKPAYRKVSSDVLAIIELRGGELRALKPSDRQNAGVLWWFSPSSQQAATDMFVWEGDAGDGIKLTAESGAQAIVKNTKPSKSKLTDLFLSHEAPRFERILEFDRLVQERGAEAMADNPRLDHFPAFYEALENCPYKQLEKPRGVWRFDARTERKYQGAPDCIPSLL